MPREFVFMDRAAIGLGAVFLHLRAELNFHRLFNEAIEDFSVERVAERQAKALAAVGLDGAPTIDRALGRRPHDSALQVPYDSRRWPLPSARICAKLPAAGLE